jgi:hypothetical protein
MDYRQRFRAALEAALDEYTGHLGKEDPTPTFLDTVTEAADTWASEYGDKRYGDGRFDESQPVVDF